MTRNSWLVLVFLRLLLLVELVSRSGLFSFAWTTSSSSFSTRVRRQVPWRLGQNRRFLALFASNEDSSNDDQQPEGDRQETDKDLKRRMAVVRSLQTSFYAPSSEGDDAHPNLDRETGKLIDLPLWRVQWWEVPGRSNVLNVHEPIYTNMFETILYGPKPWCFGHLYLQGGSRNLNSNQDKFQLESWENTTTPTTSHKDQSSAVIGCLMNISDYRRMADGRLLLLVHAMERFVVTDVVQKLPYSVVNAQVLPDLEEMDPDLALSSNDELLEEQLRYPRALAVQESVRFHDYEYDRNHKLPVPQSDELEGKDISQSDLAKVLPFAPFSKTLEPPQESSLTARRAMETKEAGEEDASSDVDDAEDEACLEYRLLSEGVLQIPGIDNSSASELLTQQQQSQQRRTHGLTTEELEYDLWLAINNFLIKTRTPVSPVLLGLLPTTTSSSGSNGDASTVNWPKGFVLKQIVKELAGLDGVDHDFVLVSKEYPAYRRQRRLAYCAANLLESDTDAANELRPKLLAAPSTHDRLRLVLEGFDHWQQEQWGAFE